MKIHNDTLKIDTDSGICIFNITSKIQSVVNESLIHNGMITVNSKHTTTAVTVNECEERLLLDIRNFFQRLVPKDRKYLHNDIHLRDCPPDEPENAHSHICAILFGNSEALPIVAGAIGLGRYQSIMLIELDGPRQRNVHVQVMGI